MKRSRPSRRVALIGPLSLVLTLLVAGISGNSCQSSKDEKSQSGLGSPEPTGPSASDFLSGMTPIPSGVPLNHPHDKIDWDVQTGKISPAQGFYFKVLADNADSELPAQYAGDLGASTVRGNETDLNSFSVDLFFKDLTLEQQRTVVLYLNPPAYRHPVQLQTGPAPSVPGVHDSVVASPTPRPTPSGVPNQDWEFIDSVSAKLRVWYKKGNARDLLIAQKTRDALSNDIMRLQMNLMQTDWVPDHPFVSPVRDQSGQPVLIGNGGDDKLDVYIAPGPVTGNAAYGARVTGIPMGVPSCVARPVYMEVNNSVGWESYWDRLKTTLAHEFFHVMQMSRNRKEWCAKYNNIDEGTATWAKPFTYPYKHHHDRDEFTKDDELSLRDASYGSWTFYYFMTHVHGNDKMREIYVGMQNASAYDAVNSAITGGFKKQWPDFVEHEWNNRPKDTGSFKEWDQYDVVPKRRKKGGAVGQTEDIDAELVQVPTNKGWIRYPMEFALAPLTRKYYYFDLSLDPLARSVSLENPVYFQKERGNLRAFLRNRNDGKWKTVDLVSQYEDQEFCLDTKAEAFDEIILMYTNFGHSESGQHVYGQHDLIVTSQGCYGYKGEYHQVADNVKSDRNQHLTLDGNLTFLNKPRVGGTHASGQYATHAGTLNYSYSGTIEGCFGSSSGPLTVVTGAQSADLGLYPYNAPPAASRGYNFAAKVDPGYVLVEHFCTPPKKNIIEAIPIMVSSMNPLIYGQSQWDTLPNGDMIENRSFPGYGGWNMQTHWDLKPLKEN
ncbi:MAG: hypothetical protein JNL01_12055 [Bdellovibrionales bacterium]|nr:hypothetical protein [Bdellovibrionales bacterium]